MGGWSNVNGVDHALWSWAAVDQTPARNSRESTRPKKRPEVLHRNAEAIFIGSSPTTDRSARIPSPRHSTALQRRSRMPYDLSRAEHGHTSGNNQACSRQFYCHRHCFNQVIQAGLQSRTMRLPACGHAVVPSRKVIGWSVAGRLFYQVWQYSCQYGPAGACAQKHTVRHTVLSAKRVHGHRTASPWHGSAASHSLRGPFAP